MVSLNCSVSEGYTALWKRRRLDLTVEALILQPQWDKLFTDEERDIARKRLQGYGYDPHTITGAPEAVYAARVRASSKGSYPNDHIKDRYHYQHVR